MTGIGIATAMCVAMLAGVALRAPIALAMGLIGAIAYVAQVGWPPLSAYLGGVMVDKFVSYDLASLPLFVLMGHIATKSGMSQSIFAAANAWIGHLRGGLAMASIAGCAAFGSICGSSVATASTMAQVALPEMKRHGYSGALSAGSLAAGGTLGILIPPSIVLIIFAILAEQNIVRLFLAATIPGLMAVVGFIIAIAIYVRIYPEEGPVSERTPLAVRFRALAGVWHVALVFLAVLGGIYGGVFTPSEGAAIGVILTMLAGFLMRSLTARSLLQCMVEAAVTTAMIFGIVLGADLFNVAMALTRMPALASDWLSASGYAPMTVLVAIVIFYLVMGCIMDELSMILLTVPVFFPAFMTLDYGLTPTEQAMWFGIIVLIVVELGMIIPPVGLNLFVITAMAPEIPTRQIFRGVLPFILIEFVRITLIIAFPALSYWLVNLVYP